MSSISRMIKDKDANQQWFVLTLLTAAILDLEVGVSEVPPTF